MRLLSSSRKAGQVPHALLFLWLLLLTAVIALMGYLVINNIRGDSDIEVQLELALERTRAAEELATSLEDKLMKAEVKLMKLQALEADSHNQCGEEIQRGKRLQRLLRHAEERLHAQGMLNSEVSLKASGNTAEIRAEDVGTAMDVRRLADTPEQVSIFYLSECFCTGIQVESVAMVTPLVHRLPNMKLNTCPEHGPRCLGYGDETKAALEQMTKRRKPKDPATEIFVSHIAYMGVCGHPAVPSTTRYTIARAMFEQDGITTIEATLCNKYDEVWVPAQFNVETFAASGVDRHRLHVVGEPVDLQLFNPDSTVPSPMLSETYGVTSTDYVFLSVFKWEERKNWKALAKAFAEEFEANPDVKLVIKTAPVHLDDHPVEEMQEYLQSLHLPRLRNGGRLMSGRGSRVVVHPESVEAKLLPQWYKRGDAFVLPTRGEGWGLPLAEAMAMRLPTIATDWGGQTEFMKPDNSFLVPTEKLVVSPQGFKWAQIDVKKLRSVMRFVYTHQKEASAVAARAHAHMHKLWSQEAVSATLEQRFRDIAKKVSTGRFDVRTSQTVAANAWEAV